MEIFLIFFFLSLMSNALKIVMGFTADGYSQLETMSSSLQSCAVYWDSEKELLEFCCGIFFRCYVVLGRSQS